MTKRSIIFYNRFKTQHGDRVNCIQMFEFHAELEAEQVHMLLHFEKMDLHMAAH